MKFTPALKTAAALTALSFATILAGPTLAQSQPSSGQSMPMPVEEDTLEADMADDVAAEVGQPAGIPIGSPTPSEQAYLLKAGDPNVVSNTPVPDTPAVRRAYGGPDSNGGKKTRPVGN